MVPVIPEPRRASYQDVQNPALRAALHFGAPVFGYTLASILVLLTGTGRLSLIGPAPFIFPFVFFYPAIALSSFMGGVGPGLAATIASAAFAILFFPGTPAPPSWIALAILAPLLVMLSAHIGQIRLRSRAITRELSKFKFISDHASDWILLLNKTGAITYVNNKALLDLSQSGTGQTASEQPGDALIGCSLQSLVLPSQRTQLTNALEKAKSGAATPIELTVQCRNASVIHVEFGFTAIRMGGEQVIYAAARDIGERKQMEKKLRELRHWESLRVLSGGLAHDFNNLLTAIIGNASLAKDYVPDNHQVAGMLDAILQSSERSANLVTMMLAAAGQQLSSSEQFHLGQLLDWTLARQDLPSNIRVAKEVSKEAAHKPLKGDRRGFETLLSSLISNAVEAYGEQYGEVRVAIRSGQAPANSTADFEEGDPGPGECVGLVVEDSGSGMTPAILERAFDPFFTTRFMGRGLGLPAVRGIVRAWSGKLRLKTAEGEGTRVEVWLPLSKD